MELFTMQTKVEKQIRAKMLAEADVERIIMSLNEQGGAKVKEAFLDVFRAVRLAAMDVGNVLRTTVGLLFTFDPNKVKEKMQAFDTRRQKINAEWAPIKQRAQEAFDNADPFLTMAVMGPTNFLTMQGIGAGLAAGKTAAEVLTATNWGEITNSFTVKLDVNQSLQQFFQKYASDQKRSQEIAADRISKGSSGGKGKGILSSLASIFSEGSEISEPLITEQKVGQGREDQAIDVFVKQSGMEKGFEEIRKPSLENIVSTIEPLMDQLAPMRQSGKLFAAKDPENFKKTLEAIRSKNPKLDPNIISKSEEALKKSTEELTKAQLEKQKKTSTSPTKNEATDAPKSNLTPEQVKAEAAKEVFEKFKKEIDSQLEEALQNAVKSSEEAIKILKIDDKVLKAMKSSPYEDSRKTAEVYEKFVSIYKEIENDFKSSKATT